MRRSALRSSNPVTPSRAWCPVADQETKVGGGDDAVKVSVDNTNDSYGRSGAQREGVTTTLSGLQYNVLKSGDGPQPGPNTPCAVHYRGTLITGQSFGELAVGLCDRLFASTACHGNTVLTAINCRSL